MGRAVFTGRITIADHFLGNIDPLVLAQSRTTISLLVLAPILLLRNRLGTSRPRPPSRAVLLARHCRTGRFELLLLLRHRAHQCGDCDCAAIRCPGMGVALHVGATVQHPTVQRIVGVLLAVVGCAFAVGEIAAQPSFPWLGLIRCALQYRRRDCGGVAAISFAFYNVYAQHLLQAYQRWTVLVYALFGAAAFWIVSNPPWKIAAHHYSGGQWAFMAVFSMTSMLIPFSFYFAGLAASRPDPRHRYQLPGTCVGNPADRHSAGRIGLAHPGARNGDRAVSHSPGTEAGSRTPSSRRLRSNPSSNTREGNCSLPSRLLHHPLRLAGRMLFGVHCINLLW